MFAELEKTWFPPGPEDNTKGILLPKPKGQDKPTRLQHAFRVKITADENAPMDTIRGLFEVQLKWEQASHAKFFDKKEGGQSLSNAEPLPADLLKQDDQNQLSLKAILYYEGAYNPKDHETPPTVTTTLTLKPKKTTSSSTQTLSASLLPVEIKEVASDQINDSDCNKLPTAKYAGEPNNPMLMATRRGVRAHLAIKVDSPEGLRDKIYVGARKVGATRILGSVKVNAPNDKTKLEFDALPGHEIYEVVAGYDQNANASLDNDEAQIIFKKTPAGSATSGLEYLDKIIIVTESQFEASKSTTEGYNLLGTGYAGELIDAFAKGATTTPNASATSPVTVASTTPGLSHPVGAKWNASNQDTTHLFTYADGSPASNDAKTSKALAEIVKKIIADKKADMLAYAGPEEWMVTPYYDFNETKDLVKTESLFDNVLGPAFGKIDFVGRLRISYKKTSATTIQVGGVEVIGSFDDLYDWAYTGAKFSFLLFTFDPREPAMVQAGHATLSKAPHSNAGKIFFTRVEFNTGFANTWNGNY